MYNYYNHNDMYYNYRPFYQSNRQNPTIEESPIIESVESDATKSSKVEDKKTYRFGPVSLCGDEIDVFGFTLHFDDIIIIGLAIFLFFENKKDYLLLIVLALMLFDLSFDSIKQFSFLKNLFSTS